VSSDPSVHLFVRCHEHGPQTFVCLEIRQPILEYQSRLSQVQRVQEHTCDRSGSEIPKKRVSPEYIVAEVEVKLNIISKYLIQEDMCAADAVAFVKT
jgi:hypothetical protein